MRRLDDAKRKEAVRKARLLLSNHADITTHSNQWRLDRARWQYQYGDPEQAAAELHDMNRLHDLYRWEGKEGYPDIPESCLMDSIGDWTFLGKRAGREGT